LSSDVGHAPTLRLFTALWPPPALRSALVSLRDRWQWPAGAAVVDADRLHATLHFIGQVPTQRLPALQDGLDVPMQAVEFRVDPGRQRVWPGGIAVLEFEVPEPLHALHDHLARALTRLGLRTEDRSWRPHVTFARKAQGAAPPGDVADLPAWHVDGYALVRSVPGRGYETLHRYPAARAEP
jgi:2'-5' RNA ligase